MNINEETGLPEVGPDEFWRISKAIPDGWSYIQLRRKLLIGSRKLGEEIFKSSYRREHYALEAAVSVLLKIERKRNPDPLYGDYPPKKLGGAQ